MAVFAWGLAEHWSAGDEQLLWRFCIISYSWVWFGLVLGG